MGKNAIFICGPTASGKTSIAIVIARWLKTEIISFDSRQFFKELKIGAAPPTEEELKLVKHHFVGNLSVTEDYSAGAFERDALLKLQELFKKYNEVVLVGGSGMYMKALIEGFDEMPDVDPVFRESLQQEYQKNGLFYLQGELKASDPEYYEMVDINNPQRLMRALEIIRSSGRKYSELRQKQSVQRPFSNIKIGLELPRKELYERIEKRVDRMIETGLEKEVRSLLKYRDKNAMQTVGYREFYPYLYGHQNFNEVIEEIKKNSRRYAKRQMTWFKRDEGIKWFHPADVEDIKSYIRSQL